MKRNTARRRGNTIRILLVSVFGSLMMVIGTVTVFFLFFNQRIVSLSAYFGIGITALKLLVCGTALLTFLFLVLFLILLRVPSDSDKPSAESPSHGAETPKQRKEGAPRFFRLCETDREMAERPEPTYSDIAGLKELCRDFRNYAASRLHLYYDESTIRTFVSSLAVTKLIIMQGISGTGKTSLACAFGDFAGNPSVVVPVQPSWKERTDLLGYFNEFTGNFNETLLLQKIYEAGYSDDVYVAVLDEMNIARVEYYFAEFLSLLEMKSPKSWMIDVVSDSWSSDPVRLKNGRLQLPENMWYVGTANNDDSTLAISDKVYDRAMVLDLDSRARPFDAPYTEPIRLSAERFGELKKQAQRKYRLTRRSRSRIDRLDAFMTENLGIAFGNRIMKQIEEFVPVYIACGGTEEEAVDILIAKKVLRKLEAKNPLTVRRQTPAFLLTLDELFGEDAMPVSRRYLSKFEL